MKKSGRKKGAREIPNRILLMSYELNEDFPHIESDIQKNEGHIHNTVQGFQQLLFDENGNHLLLKNYHGYKELKENLEEVKRHPVYPVEVNGRYQRIGDPPSKRSVYIITFQGREKGKKLLDSISQETISLKDKNPMSLGEIIQEKRQELWYETILVEEKPGKKRAKKRLIQDRYIYHFSLSHLINSKIQYSWSELNQFFPHYSDVAFPLKKDDQYFTFQEYLVHINEQYRFLPIEFRGSLDLSINSIMDLDLLPHDGYSDGTNKQEQKDEARSLDEILRSFFKPPPAQDTGRHFIPQPIVIMGDAGQGKTVLLQHHFFKQNESQISDISMYLPLLSYAGESIFDFLLHSLRHRDHLKRDKQALEVALTNGRLSLFFDGFDEICKEYKSKFIENLQSFNAYNEWKQTRIVITSRRNEKFPQSYRVYEISPFSNIKIRELLFRWKCDNLIPLIFQDNRILELVRNPLLFTLFVVANIKDHLEEITTRSLLIKMGVENWLQRWGKKDSDELEASFGLNFKMNALGEFALRLMIDEKLDFSKDYFISCIGGDRTEDLFSEFVEKDNIFIRSGSSYRFYHQIFHDYLTASYLVTEPYELKKTLLNDTQLLDEKRWWPIYEHVAGLINPDDLIASVQSNFEEDIYLSNLRLFIRMAIQGKSRNELMETLFSAGLQVLTNDSFREGIRHDILELLSTDLVNLSNVIDLNTLITIFENCTDENMLEIIVPGLIRDTIPEKIEEYLWEGISNKESLSIRDLSISCLLASAEYDDRTFKKIHSHLKEVGIESPFMSYLTFSSNEELLTRLFNVDDSLYSHLITDFLTSKTESPFHARLLSLNPMERRLQHDDDTYYSLIDKCAKFNTRSRVYYRLTHRKYLTKDRISHYFSRFTNIQTDTWFVEYMNNISTHDEEWYQSKEFEELISLIGHSSSDIEKLRSLTDHVISGDIFPVINFTVAVLLRRDRDWMLKRLSRGLEEDGIDREQIYYFIYEWKIVELYDSLLTHEIERLRMNEFSHIPYAMIDYLENIGIDERLLSHIRLLSRDEMLDIILLLLGSSYVRDAKVRGLDLLEEELYQQYSNENDPDSRFRIVYALSKFSSQSSLDKLNSIFTSEITTGIDGQNHDVILNAMGGVVFRGGTIDIDQILSVVNDGRLDILKDVDEMGIPSKYIVYHSYETPFNLLIEIIDDESDQIALMSYILMRKDFSFEFLKFSYWNFRDKLYKILDKFAHFHGTLTGDARKNLLEVMLKFRHPGAIKEVLSGPLSQSDKLDYLILMLRLIPQEHEESSLLLTDIDNNRIISFLQSLRRKELHGLEQEYFLLCNYFSISNRVQSAIVNKYFKSNSVHDRIIALTQILKRKSSSIDFYESISDNIHYSISEDNLMRLLFPPEFYEERFFKRTNSSYAREETRKILSEDKRFFFYSGDQITIQIPLDYNLPKPGTYSIIEFLTASPDSFFREMEREDHQMFHYLSIVMESYFKYHELLLCAILKFQSRKIIPTIEYLGKRKSLEYCILTKDLRVNENMTELIRENIEMIINKCPNLRIPYLINVDFSYPVFIVLMEISQPPEQFIILSDFFKYYSKMEDRSNVLPHLKYIHQIAETSKHKAVRRISLNIIAGCKDIDSEPLILSELNALVCSLEEEEECDLIDFMHNFGLCRTYRMRVYCDIYYSNMRSNYDSQFLSLNRFLPDRFEAMLFTHFKERSIHHAISAYHQCTGETNSPFLRMLLDDWIGFFGCKEILQYINEIQGIHDIIQKHYTRRIMHERVPPINVRLPLWLLTKEQSYPPIQIG